MPAFINHKMFNMNKHAYKTWKIREIKSSSIYDNVFRTPSKG